MGIQLKKKGIDDFVILEKAESVGGTWRENRYPGIACDVPSHLYSFSFELNPNWSHSYSSGREIWDYCERCVEKYGLGPHIRFGTEVSDVVFDAVRWTVTTKDGGRVTANLVVSGLGGLHSPKHADIEGLKGFEGPVFHTAEWPDGFDLKGRRVAIIGTGAIAAQVLPAIADDVADVTVFQRSAAWVFPRLARYSGENAGALPPISVADAGLSLVSLDVHGCHGDAVAPTQRIAREAAEADGPQASGRVRARPGAAPSSRPITSPAASAASSPTTT